MKRSELFFSVILLPVDCLALLGAFVFSYNLRGSSDLITSITNASIAARLKYDPSGALVLTYDHYLRYLGVIIPAMLLIFAFSGLYTIRSNVSWPKRIAQIFIGVSMGEFFILILFLLKKDFFLPRSVVLLSWILGTVLVLLGRLLVRALQKQLYLREMGIVRMGVIGSGRVAKDVMKQLDGNPYTAYRVVLHMENPSVDTAIDTIHKANLDELIVVSDQYNNDEMIRLREFCLESDISFSFVPALLTALESTFDVQTIRGLPMIEVRPTPLEGWGRVMKRAFDIVGAIFFIILFSPFFLLITLLIKLTSPGPLIYKHRRIGKNRESVTIWKFRSMRWEYCTGVGHNGDDYFRKLLSDHPDLEKEWRQTQKLKNDPRVSGIGKILRRTHLDELPQFFNVLFGRLSLVGPRPVVEEEVTHFGEKANILFTVKPGITGPWQVHGGNDLEYTERVKMNAQYIEHWNLWRDIVILLETGLLLFRRGDRGAY
ncbi:exopolysaccharide biosynthesis polyprenyl glycosylphosphotransferase [Patescibacteria group bacterium]|nr:exopolysaccharide biosynthesis polyprenyl glycosylphosphotransferase [Patescibacteria group bacterium]